MTKYYHSAPLALQAGSIIEPGNWGRILNCYTSENGNAWLLARELAFESIRSSDFKDLPSRLSSCFVFDNLDHANQYQREFSRWNSLYEVELVNETAPTHQGAFNLVSFPNNQTEFLPVVINNARKYWAGEEIQVPEIITKSPLLIKNVVSGAPACYQP